MQLLNCFVRNFFLPPSRFVFQHAEVPSAGSRPESAEKGEESPKDSAALEGLSQQDLNIVIDAAMRKLEAARKAGSGEPLNEIAAGLKQEEKTNPSKLIEDISVFINSKEFGNLFKAIYENSRISQSKKDEIGVTWKAELRLEFARLRNRVESMPFSGENPEELAIEITIYREKLDRFIEELKVAL